MEIYADMLKPSKLKVSIVNFNFPGIELNRAATRFKFIYGKGERNYVYLHASWPEQEIEFDLKEADDDTELEIIV